MKFVAQILVALTAISAFVIYWNKDRALDFFSSTSTYVAVSSDHETGDFLVHATQTIKDIVDETQEAASIGAKSSKYLRQQHKIATSTATVSSTVFTDSFSTPQTVEEANILQNSSSIDWWVSSGAWLEMKNGIGRPPVGEVSPSSYWAREYAANNSTDTDNGTHPQNIFRLVNIRNTWKDFEQTLYFKIDRIITSSSPNRNASNGVLLFNRYQTGDNLYYAGLRVDGQVVVKKKLNGVYYTLGVKKILPGVYNRDSNPDLIPTGQWIGIKTAVSTDSNNVVHVKLYTDIGRTGVWTLVLDTSDDGKLSGQTINTAGYGGIRTDFMDVQFDDFSFSAL